MAGRGQGTGTAPIPLCLPKETAGTDPYKSGKAGLSGLSAVYNEKAEGVTDLPEGKKRETENPRIQGNRNPLYPGILSLCDSKELSPCSAGGGPKNGH